MVRKALRRPYAKVKFPGRDLPDLWRSDWDGAISIENGSYELRWGSIALGTIGYEKDVEQLLTILHGGGIRRHVSPKEWYPGRAFAALGLGIYLRRMGEDVDQMRDESVEDQIEDVVRHLARYAAEEGEPLNFRSVCLLALGISGDVRQVKAIHEALDTPGGRTPLVRGYGVLALSMLEDDSAIEAARRLLPEPKNVPLTAARIKQRWTTRPTNVEAMLGLRAAIRGLGLLGTPKAAALIKTTFGRETFSSLAAARALRRCDDTDLIAPLKKLVDNRENPQLARMAIMALGELLASEQSSRLRKRLVEQSLLVWPVGQGSLQERMEEVPIYAYRRLAHPFLYEVLIPHGTPGNRY